MVAYQDRRKRFRSPPSRLRIADDWRTARSDCYQSDDRIPSKRFIFRSCWPLDRTTPTHQPGTWRPCVRLCGDDTGVVDICGRRSAHGSALVSTVDRIQGIFSQGEASKYSETVTPSLLDP